MPLSKALEDYTDIFPEYYIKNIYAAEFGGVLQENLGYLAIYLRSEKQLQMKIKNTFVYPKMVFFIIILGGLLIAFVQGMLDFTQKNVLLITLITVSIVLINDLIKTHFSSGKGRHFWDVIRLKVFYFGGIYKKMLNQQFAELFIPMYRSGLPITDVFRLVGNAIDNKMYSSSIIEIGNRIDGGEKIAESVEQCVFFPFSLKSLFQIGEKTGEIDRNMDHFIRQSKSEMELSLKTAMYIVYVVFMVVLVIAIQYMRSIFL